MATYTADINWKLADGEDFPKGRYSRGHTLRFDGGTVVPASASPHVVGKWAVEAAVDPEEMLVAALSDLPHAFLPTCGATGRLHHRGLSATRSH
jgi:organic hydroperoxide reductase OsmC/OhrA